MAAQVGAHILLVEDDIDLAKWIADYLTGRDFKGNHLSSR
jgi:DNA-binding response OmpR family regulator